jgi:ATP phosphoribosyltransferase regulatory subunit
MTSPDRKPTLASLVRRRRRATTAALAALAGWGYEEAEVPLLVPYDALRDALGGDASDLFRFTDREGRLLLLRSDLTPIIAWQLARTLDTRTLPVRVSYANRVARIQRAFAGERVESHEIGAELFGAPGLAGDLECLVVAWDVLTCLGLEDVEVHVANVAIAELLVEAASNVDSQALRSAIARRDRNTVRELANGVAPELAQALAALCSMRPDASDVRAARAPQIPGLDAAFAHLEALRDGVTATGCSRVQFDLSAKSDRRYYTGLFFRVLANGAEGPIAAGGRYDRLLGAFGRPVPAVGFGVQVENVIAVLEARSAAENSTDAGDAMLVGADSASLVAALGARRQGRPVRVSHTAEDGRD